MPAARPFTHLDAAGHARMVDVTHKQPTVRAATASGRVVCGPDIVAALRPAGSRRATCSPSRVSRVAAAKRTAELLPLAHVIGVRGVVVDLLRCGDDGVAIRATVRTAGTGVEMEALTAVSVTALAVVDMSQGPRQVRIECAPSGSRAGLRRQVGRLAARAVTFDAVVLAGGRAQRRYRQGVRRR